MAEEVWYAIVWEQQKDANNVIDYNIREEQTKDVFAIDNANNQTTTGMAWVIPWINELKLRAETSIVWWVWWSWWALLASTAEYWISTPPWTSIVKYTLENLSSPWWDLYIENSDIHIDWGTYLVVANSYIWNSSVTSTILDLRYYDENWYIWHVWRWYWGQYTNWCAIFTFQPWYYIRLRVQLNYDTTASDISLNFIKVS